VTEDSRELRVLPDRVPGGPNGNPEKPRIPWPVTNEPTFILAALQAVSLECRTRRQKDSRENRPPGLPSRQ
jgi:hypothetical protein